MKFIISGTNRPQSRTLQISKLIQKLYKEEGEEVGIIDLTHVGLEQIPKAALYGNEVPDVMKSEISKINSADGLIVVCPEYNGSMPGALKYFIDHWQYPDSYEYRPISLVGLGGKFGGLRPVEHLQGVFGYRNAFIFPERVFIVDVPKILNSAGDIDDANIRSLLVSQVKGFQAFTKALSSAGLDANSRLSKK